MQGSRNYTGLKLLKEQIEGEYRILRLESLKVRKQLKKQEEQLDELQEMIKEIMREDNTQSLLAV